MIKETLLVVIDMQGKLASMVIDAKGIERNVLRLIEAAKVLDIPIIHTEQVPEKIGPTIDSIKQQLTANPIVKFSFSCFQEPAFREQINKIQPKKVILIGIETHVCVYQTAMDLKRHGYNVEVVAVAVSARHHADHDLAIDRLRHEGVGLMSGEMLMCDLIQTAKHPRFKEIISLLKQ